MLYIFASIIHDFHYLEASAASACVLFIDSAFNNIISASQLHITSHHITSGVSNLILKASVWVQVLNYNQSEATHEPTE